MQLWKTNLLSTLLSTLWELLWFYSSYFFFLQLEQNKMVYLCKHIELQAELLCMKPMKNVILLSRVFFHHYFTGTQRKFGSWNAEFNMKSIFIATSVCNLAMFCLWPCKNNENKGKFEQIINLICDVILYIDLYAGFFFVENKQKKSKLNVFEVSFC